MRLPISVGAGKSEPNPVYEKVKCLISLVEKIYRCRINAKSDGKNGDQSSVVILRLNYGIIERNAEPKEERNYHEM
jgi:hypothetical protein